MGLPPNNSVTFSKWLCFSESQVPHFQNWGPHRYLTELLWDFSKTMFSKEPSALSGAQCMLRNGYCYIFHCVIFLIHQDHPYQCHRNKRLLRGPTECGPGNMSYISFLVCHQPFLLFKGNYATTWALILRAILSGKHSNLEELTGWADQIRWKI